MSDECRRESIWWSVDKRVRKGIEVVKGEEQCGFRKGRGCVSQIFAVRQLYEKFLAKGWEVYFAFMDLLQIHITWTIIYSVIEEMIHCLKILFVMFTIVVVLFQKYFDANLLLCN